MTRRRFLPLAALTLATLTASSATAAGSTGRLHTTVPLPAAGHMTVAAIRMSASGAQLPLRAKLRAPNAGKLPPSVKVLFATRSVPTRHGRRYAAAIFVVRKADAQASSAAAHRTPDVLDLVLWIDQRASWESQVVAIRNADKARRRARKLRALDDLFRNDFTVDGDPGNVFDNPSGPPDPTLDTGHYDDGHSFGWGAKGLPELSPDEIFRVEIDLVEDLIERQPAQLMPDLELATAVDLNGDGAVGSGQQIDTRVGPIVIS